MLAFGTLADVVVDNITNAILRGDLKPGERLGEERVARGLGISRAPVREAARLLTERGLLVQHPRRGFFVRRFTVEEIVDLYDMRIAIERHALLRLFELDRVAALAEPLGMAFDTLEQAAAAGEIGAIARADLAFHRCMIEMAGNRRLLRHFDELAAELTILNGVIGLHYEEPDYLVATHTPIMSAVRRADRQGAIEAVERHVSQARDNMTRHFSGTSTGAP